MQYLTGSKPGQPQQQTCGSMKTEPIIDDLYLHQGGELCGNKEETTTVIARQVMMRTWEKNDSHKILISFMSWHLKVVSYTLLKIVCCYSYLANWIGSST